MAIRMNREGVKVEAGSDLCWQPNPLDVNPFHENASDSAVFRTVLRGHKSVSRYQLYFSLTGLRA